MQNTLLIRSTLFGSITDQNNMSLSFFGRMCRIKQGAELQVLLNPSRSFFNRITDIILIDPIGNFGNVIAYNSREKSRHNYKPIEASETSIFYRKATTAFLWSIDLANFTSAIIKPDATLLDAIITTATYRLIIIATLLFGTAVYALYLTILANLQSSWNRLWGA